MYAFACREICSPAGGNSLSHTLAAVATIADLIRLVSWCLPFADWALFSIDIKN